MTLKFVLRLVIVLFPVSEIVLAIFKRANKNTARIKDEGSAGLLWISIAMGIGLAIACRWIPSANFQFSQRFLIMFALSLMVSGLAIRWAAILTLGKFFTVDVAIHSEHSLVQTGLYRIVRHPSYTGLLITFLGLAITFGNWLSIVSLMAPVLSAVINRIVKEERTLHAALGEPYAVYCQRTKRLIPWLY
jgi:protein-S-isoprenylcysteine O-methyltransferase